MRGRHTLAAASGMLCLMLVSGCGGGAEPQPLPKPTASFDPSESPSPTPPVMPSAAKEKTKAGAIAFTGGFIEALNYAGAAGDTEELRSLYLPLCTRCEAIADGIDQTYASGGYFKGGEWRPTRYKLYAIKNSVAVLDAIVRYEAQTWVKKSGAKPVTFKASAGNLKAFNLRWQGDGWRVSALDPTP